MNGMSGQLERFKVVMGMIFKETMYYWLEKIYCIHLLNMLKNGEDLLQVFNK